MSTKTSLTILAFALVTSASASALASPDYPGVIVSTLNIQCRPVQPAAQNGNANEPDCTLCHSSSTGGGAPTEPFGIALVKFGLVPNNAQSLQDALAKMEAAKTDSNGDGIPDVDALRACKNPNGAGVGYGCSASGESGGLLWVAIAAIAGVVIGRRRRR